MTQTNSDASSPNPSNGRDGGLPSVAVIGVGAMGMPMAQRLHQHGFATRTVDVSPARVEQCRSAGLTAHTELDTVVGCDIVLAMVATGPQLLDLLAAPVITSGRMRGKVLVVLSTIGPDVLKEAAAAAERHGVLLLDCPVTGGVTGATAGTLTLFASGAPDTLVAARVALDVIGAVRVVGSQPGDGQAFKLVNQMLAAIHLAAAGEAFAFAERLGLDLSLVQELLPTGAANSWMLADRGPRMIQPKELRPTETQLSLFVKDSGLVATAADANGAHIPLTRAARAAWTRAAELGLRDGDDSGVVEAFRNG